MKVVIIGAGILGSSTAYHLVKNGCQVTIVDPEIEGRATSAAAGILCPWLTNRSNETWYELVTKGAAYYPKLMKELQTAGHQVSGYRSVGAINIFDTEAKLEKKYSTAIQRQESSPEMGEIKTLSRSETQKMFPVLSEDYMSLYISGGARVNGEAIRKSLLDAAIDNGATYIRQAANLSQDGEVIVGTRFVVADQVVITNGAWMKPLFQRIGVETEFSYEKAQIVHLKLKHSSTRNWPVLLPPFGHYQLGTEDNRILIGATREEGADPSVTAGGVYELLNKSLRVSPGLAKAEYIGTRVGFRPFTPNSLPAVGKVPHFDHIWMANGLGASGLTSGPYLGLELANHMMERGTTIDLSKFPVNHLFNR